MSQAPWLSIVGIGEDGIDGLSNVARFLISQAEILVGGERHLAFVPADFGPRQRWAWTLPFEASLERLLARRGQATIILASGDPMDFGIGATLARRLPSGEMRVLPHPGACSLAAARLGWPLQEVRRVSLHGRPLAGLARHLAPGARIFAFSENRTTPHTVAAYLAGKGWGASSMSVLERLGGPRESIVHGRADSLPAGDYADLNLLAIECRADAGTPVWPLLPGLPDEAFRHDGQLTKRLVRAATLSLLAPLPGEMLWDVGSGAGSIAIEWLRGAERMGAIAIERDAGRCRFIAENAETLGVPELRIVAGSAPEALVGLPSPDAIFVGGGLDADLAQSCWDALKPGGRLVANTVTVEGEAVALALARRHRGKLSRVAVSDLDALGVHHVWREALAVTQLLVRKP